MRVAAFSFLGVSGLVAACASDPPPKPAEPQAAPLEIPPLPPQKEPPSRPTTREVPPPSAEPAEPSMSVPGPLALPCTNDNQCGTHRCNAQYGKCAFPCTSDTDCIAGSTCYSAQASMAVCIPKPVP